MSESCVPWFWMVSMGLVYSVMVYSVLVCAPGFGWWAWV